jgi:hypothetical protein
MKLVFPCEGEFCDRKSNLSPKWSRCIIICRETSGSGSTPHSLLENYWLIVKENGEVEQIHTYTDVRFNFK